MNHLALIEQTRSLIAAGDITGAEAALTELADTDGDGALVVVLEQLAPKDILAVIREYDQSRESIINLLVTPGQFARAMVIEKQYKDLTHTHLRGMVNSVVFRDEADPVEFLEAIALLEGGSEAMANSFDTAEEDGEMLSEQALFATAYAKPKLELDEIADQDWMQLAWLLRYQCPDLFIEMMLVMRAKARAHDLGLDQEEEAAEDDGKVETGDTDRGHATPAARDDDEESAI
jgi:hypothetical protein